MYLRVIVGILSLNFVLSGSDMVIKFAPQEQEFIKEKKEITMCVDPDWEPFEKIDEKQHHVGIAADLIQLVSKRIGVPIRLVPTATWQETLKFSKSGKCDILSFVNQTPEREKWLIFTKPLLSDPNVMITREEHPFIGDAHGLNQEKVVLPEGTYVLERMPKEFPNLKYIPVVTEADAMQMVSEKKADLTVRSLIVAADVINKEGWFNLKIAGRIPGYENHLRIGVLKDQPVLRDILNKGIATIDPIEKETIINKHTGLVVKEGIDRQSVLWSVGALLGVLGIIVLWNTILRWQVRKAVTEKLRIKEQLYQNMKQAEIGSLIANISHQWREPLSKLSSINLLTMVKLKTDQPIEREWLKQQTDDIENTIDFMSQTMQNFLEFYKKNDRQSTFSIADSIQSVLSIIETKLTDNNIAVKINEAEVIMIDGIKNEWMQVWLNLVNNSISALIEHPSKSPQINIRIAKNSVTICDNAGGMDLTKEYHGLGLPMCHDILEKYGSSLELKNSAAGLCAVVSIRA